MKASIQDRDKGYAALLTRLYGAGKTKPVVRVGVQSQDGDRPHPKPETAKPGPVSAGERAVLTVLQVAIINEFGSADGRRPPARSFLRAWFDENQEVIREKFRILMRSVVKGDRTKEQILDLIGQWCVGQIQLRIARGIAPALAESTLRRKTVNGRQGNVPLINTGTLRSSITYRVDGK